MSVGTYISVCLHGALIILVLVGLPFQKNRQDTVIEMPEVSMISVDDFEAMVQSSMPDAVPLNDVTPPMQLQTDPVPDTQPVIPDSPVIPVQELDVRPVMTSDPTPVPNIIDFIPPVDFETPPVDLPLKPAVDASVRPVSRVASVAVAPPPPDVDIGEAARDAVRADERATQQADLVDQSQAREAANTEIVTEENAGNAPPTSSMRPQGRPERAVEVEVTEAADQNSVASALAAALADSGAHESAMQAGPQSLSIAESQGLMLALQDCWNVGFLSSQALATTIVVGVDFSIDGRPDPASLRLVDYSGGSRNSAQQAFIAARSAILECGQEGFELPRNIYDTWRSMELVFNPSKMRVR